MALHEMPSVFGRIGRINQADDIPKLHRLFLKRCALRDKEAYTLLVQMYNDLQPWERESFLEEVIRESDKTREKLKQAELAALETQECRHADETDEAEREELRDESP